MKPGLGDLYTYGAVDHSKRVYVSGDIHVLAIEGFWSLVKRGISGVYHSVSSDHLQSYLDEYMVLLVIKDHPLPGGSVLRIRPFKEPMDVPSGFTVPFYEDGRCLLLYELPLRTEEPMRLVLILNPYFFSASPSS